MDRLKERQLGKKGRKNKRKREREREKEREKDRERLSRKDLKKNKGPTKQASNKDEPTSAASA